jgi:hypothetical protein
MSIISFTYMKNNTGRLPKDATLYLHNFLEAFQRPVSENENKEVRYFNFNAYGNKKNTQNSYYYQANIVGSFGVIFEIRNESDDDLNLDIIAQKLSEVFSIIYMNPESSDYTVLIPFGQGLKINSIKPIIKYFNKLFNGKITSDSINFNKMYRTPYINTPEERKEYNCIINTISFDDPTRDKRVKIPRDVQRRTYLDNLFRNKSFFKNAKIYNTSDET